MLSVNVVALSYEYSLTAAEISLASSGDVYAVDSTQRVHHKLHSFYR